MPCGPAHGIFRWGCRVCLCLAVRVALSPRALRYGTTALQQFTLDAYAVFLVPQVSGPFGIFFAPPATPSVQPGTISVVTEPRSDINNAELAAGAYVQFLQGQKPKEFDLDVGKNGSRKRTRAAAVRLCPCVRGASGSTCRRTAHGECSAAG